MTNRVGFGVEMEFVCLAVAEHSLLKPGSPLTIFHSSVTGCSFTITLHRKAYRGTVSMWFHKEIRKDTVEVIFIASVRVQAIEFNGQLMPKVLSVTVIRNQILSEIRILVGSDSCEPESGKNRIFSNPNRLESESTRTRIFEFGVSRHRTTQRYIVWMVMEEEVENVSDSTKTSTTEGRCSTMRATFTYHHFNQRPIAGKP